MNQKYKDLTELRKKLVGFKGLTLIELANHLDISYNTIKGWKSKKPDYYACAVKHLIDYATTRLNDTDKSRVASNLITMLLKNDFEEPKETNIKIKTDPLDKLGWN